MNYKVFISHSSTDAWVANQIKKYIDGFKATTFLDEGCIDAGDDFENVILKELRSSKELLVLFTPWSLERPYLWMEVGAAWGIGLRIVGVLYGLSEKDINENSKTPVLIKKSNLVELNDINKYFNQLKKRIK